jgi:alkylation response protein AidB-like acyl-CoA dehydrogenase
MSTGIETAGLSDTQRQIVDLAREFSRSKIEPHAAEWDRLRHFPRDVVDELGKLGFLGALAPEEYEGMGLDGVTYALGLEELAAADAGVAAAVATHNAVPTALLARHGSDAQRERWLKPMARGTLLAAIAVAESDAGSDTAALSTRAVRDGDGWVLDGTKAWVSHGAAADVVIVLARSADGVSAFLVPTAQTGCRAGEPADTMGLRSAATVPVVLAGVRLPADHLLGTEGEGLAYIAEASDVARLGCAVVAVGIARRALEHAVGYCGERRQFGQALREFEAVQFKLAEMATRVEAARGLAHLAAARRDRGEDAGVAASMAKLFASETAMWVTTQAIQLFGGYGYMRDFPVEKLFRDAKATEILEGTSEMQRLTIARGLARDR